MRNVFKQSFSIGIRQWRIAAIVYFIQVCLALIVGMEVYHVLGSSIGNSLEINKLLAHYDHTVLTDFLKVHGASITPLIGQLRWILLVWLLFSVFLHAGLLVCAARSEQANSRRFWKAGAEYFFPFLKISLVFLLLALLLTVVALLPIALFLQASLQYFSSEKYSVAMVLTLLLLYGFGLIKLYIWSVVSRLNHIETGASTFKSIRNGWRIFWKNKWILLGFVLGFMVLQLLLLVLYWQLEAFSGMTSAALIGVFFVVQQAFVCFRIQIRQMMYAGIDVLISSSGE